MNRIARLASRAGRRTMQAGERIAGSTLDLMRRGERTVITTPSTGLRLGNLLYVWLQAHRRTRAGAPTLAREARAMAPWLTAFPELSALTIAPGGVRFSDRRTWDDAWLYQRFGVDFTADDLAAFVRETLASHVVPDRTETLVINVRRGDYYAEFASKYAFDQAGYLAATLDRLAPAERALVVSDDADWCRTNLDSVIRMRADEVEYARPDPLANFLAVAGAARIIGTNSTFTYWAAYVAGVIHANAEVVMPRFHARMAHGTDAHQLDPRWTIIDGFH
ncbi:alpha-1,2-fucosyltransferase [Agromyces sp. SYSU K20354]|uniref:alpha-1,2-fucosyltransferase n=1 Tax=Agromyces cavernae TaxID=2898659 RepID=UPI001E593466|nr:alpha-1,2-fucosyltransferase [Agromyces cavernae]MCD2441012.1 alpha-1,2-fucosyltransferase [Agromyces cavernae]